MNMSTALKVSQESGAKSPLSVESSAIQSTQHKGSDFLGGLELQMKELWAQYVRCLDQGGLTDAAKKLRNQYYNLYRCYRQNKNWREMVNN